MRHTMFLFTAMLSLMTPAAHAGDSGILSVGFLHTCVITMDGLKCWGENNAYGQLNVPPLRHPTQVSAGDHQTCAIDDDGVKCWGMGYGESPSLDRSLIEIPPLKRPTQVSVGNAGTCAIDDDGVKCWNGMIAPAPQFSHPTQVSVGNSFACVIHDNGLTCWGYRDYSWITIGPSCYGISCHLTDSDDRRRYRPIQVSVGYDAQCAIYEDSRGEKDNRVYCSYLWWGAYHVAPRSIFNPFATQISMSYGDICIISDADGVKCGSSSIYSRIPIDLPIPLLRHPTLISSGSYGVCAVDDDGLKCWSSGNSDQEVREIPVPASLNIFPTLNDPRLLFTKLETVLATLRDYVPQIKSEFFKKSSDYLAATPEVIGGSRVTKDRARNPRAMFMLAIKPLILGTDSETFFDKVHPAYLRAIKTELEKNGIKGMADIPQTAEIRLAALKLIQFSLEAAKKYTSDADQVPLAGVLSALAAAETNPSDDGAIKAFLTALDNRSAWLAGLSQSSRTQWISSIIHACADWLRAK